MPNVDLDALPIQRVPAAIAQLAARLLTAPTEPATATLLTVEEAAKRLNVTPRYVYRHTKLHKAWGALRISARKLRFRRSAVERYLKEREG